MFTWNNFRELQGRFLGGLGWKPEGVGPGGSQGSPGGSRGSPRGWCLRDDETKHVDPLLHQNAVGGTIDRTYFRRHPYTPLQLAHGPPNPHIVRLPCLLAPRRPLAALRSHLRLETFGHEEDRPRTQLHALSTHLNDRAASLF